MRKISLTQGYVTLVDDADFEKVSQFNWHALVTSTGVYAIGRPFPPRRAGRKPAGQVAEPKPPKMLLHRWLLGITEEDVEVDHRDLNTLNNQRKNLRIGTKQQNRCNQRKRSGTSSRYKGVAWNKRSACWHAKIETYGVVRYIGSFKGERAAALAYDRAAYSYHGEFASFNFPNNLQHRKGWLHKEDTNVHNK